MPTDTMSNGSYIGILTANAGLENRLNFHQYNSHQYNSLEVQINQIQAEPEDPPETMHTPWGIWRHYWDALHRIDEMFDAEHLVRKSRPAEDILHEAHYVPVIGDHDHKVEAYEMNIEYDDPVQLEVYNSKINLKFFAETGFEGETQDESAGISMSTETEDSSIGSEGRDIGEKLEEMNNNDGSQDRAKKKNLDSKSGKELTINLRSILQLVLKVEGFKWYYPAL